MNLANLPGVNTEPGRRNSRYQGSAADYIEQLRGEGAVSCSRPGCPISNHLSWYHNGKSPAEPELVASRCGYLAIYYLHGDTAYTKNSDGKPHMAHHKLKVHQKDPCWGCEGCKTRFFTWPEAKAHADEQIKKEEN